MPVSPLFFTFTCAIQGPLASSRLREIFSKGWPLAKEYLALVDGIFPEGLSRK